MSNTMSDTTTDETIGGGDLAPEFDAGYRVGYRAGRRGSPPFSPVEETPLYAPPFVVERITTVDIGHMVKAIREGLSVEVSELAEASGLRRKRIEAIEAGRATTAEERHHIAVAVASILTSYTTEAKGGRCASLPEAEMLDTPA